VKSRQSLQLFDTTKNFHGLYVESKEGTSGGDEAGSSSIRQMTKYRQGDVLEGRIEKLTLRWTYDTELLHLGMESGPFHPEFGRSTHGTTENPL
jgi:hypothetical protein